MRFVRRDSAKAPAVLTKKDENTGKTETEEATEHYNKWPELKKKDRKSFDYKAYSKDEVKDELYKMFNNKCAYCETRLAGLPMDVEHWRPKNAVYNEKTKKLMKPGYFWLGADWDNLFPSCADCNRARNHKHYLTEEKTKLGKANRFPIEDENKRCKKPGDEDNEKPLLINPCKDNPEEYLEFSEECVVQAKLDNSGKPHEKANVSIEIYALNRPILVQDRQEIFLHVEMHIDDITDLTEDLLNENDLEKQEKIKERINRKMKTLEQLTEPKHQYILMVKQRIEKFKSGA